VHTAEIRFQYDAPNTADLVAEAVGQELGEIDADRSTASISREESQLSVEIDADDLVALRAALNTWGTLLEVAERMVEVGSSR